MIATFREAIWRGDRGNAVALYLQEKTSIIGMHPNRRLFARSIAQYAAALNAPDSTAPMRNMGVWEFVGMTGEWAKVLGLYEFPNGWTSFTDMIAQTMRDPAPELAATYRAVEERRTGGSDEILESLDGSPTYADLKSGPGGALLVIDEARVEAGEEGRYGARIMRDALPLAQANGRRLIGLYKGALTEGLVITYWATSLEAYAAFSASSLMDDWRSIGREARVDWRQELWTATPGTALADASIDYGDRDIREG